MRGLGSEQREESREHQIWLKLAGAITGTCFLQCHWSVEFPNVRLFLTFFLQDSNPWGLRDGSVGTVHVAQHEDQSLGPSTHIKLKQQGVL